MAGDLSTTAASRVLGVHAKTLCRWADEGKVAHWKTPNGQRRFRVEDLEALKAPVAPKTQAQ